jgi:hypothetical protein
MRKLLLLILFQHSIITGFCQISGIVLDKETGTPIPYANIGVTNSFIGATSSLKGEFTIKECSVGQELIVTSIGYKEQSIKLTQPYGIIVKLEPKVYTIKELIVKPKKAGKGLVVNPISKSKRYCNFTCNGYPWIITKYFEYKNDYEEKPFIKELKILTESNVQNAKFNLRLIAANAEGMPCNDMLETNMIIEVKKGSRVVKVDLRDRHITFPKGGFFVGLEWLIIEDNKTEITYSINGDNKKHNRFRYSPSFGGVKNKGDNTTCIYSGDKWRKANFFHKPEDSGFYLEPMVELLLAD